MGDHSIRYQDRAGACLKKNPPAGTSRFSSCEIHPIDCNEDEEWDHYYEGCDPNDIKIGRCLADNSCAKDRNDCLDTSTFNPGDESCTIQHDHSKAFDSTFTQFGSCRNNASLEEFCVWSSRDCDPDTETYVKPAETQRNCDCSETHIGVELLSQRALCNCY